MNRTIKFRQWHPGYKNTVKPHMEEPIDWLPADRFGEWMQFTGLLDRNGKEIYEGDIVKPPNGKAKQVIWDYTYFEELNRHCKDVEIIGNIYENPELLIP